MNLPQQTWLRWLGQTSNEWCVPCAACVVRLSFVLQLKAQAEYDVRMRRQAEEKKLKEQRQQKAILDSLEEQLLIKTQEQERDLIERQAQAVQLKKDTEAAFQKGVAEVELQQQKKIDYRTLLDEQME